MSIACLSFVSINIEMISVGSLVKFTWWSSYKAPSVLEDSFGRPSWHEIFPGDTGVVICTGEGESVAVLFSRIDTLLKINQTMLEKM